MVTRARSLSERIKRDRENLAKLERQADAELLKYLHDKKDIQTLDDFKDWEAKLTQTRDNPTSQTDQSQSAKLDEATSQADQSHSAESANSAGNFGFNALDSE